MTRVSISCPITWHEQTTWIKEHCEAWQDDTNWAAWQIGLDDIYFWIPERDATFFILRWR